MSNGLRICKDEFPDKLFGNFSLDNDWDGDDWIDKVDISQFATEMAPNLDEMAEIRSGRECPPTGFPKPVWSYSCLIALALKNSATGQLTVSEIYSFMCEHFPYFRTAPGGWKNSVRHNLSLNKCFAKVEVEADNPENPGRKSCLWMIRHDKMDKIEMDIRKWREKGSITEGMAHPEDLEAIEGGRQGMPPLRSIENMDRPILEPIQELPVKQPSILKVFSRPIPAILDRRSSKRPSSPASAPSPASSSLTPSSLASSAASLPLPRVRLVPPSTPSKSSLDFLSSSSPLRPSNLFSDYDSANAALTNNSLLVSALGQSPYRGPTTFPHIAS